MDEILKFTVSDYRGAFIGAVIGSLLTAILTAIGWLHIKARRRLQQSFARNIWKSFLVDKSISTCVVLTTKPSNRPSGTPKVSLSEVQGFSEVRRTLGDLDVEAKLIEDPDIHLNQLDGKHIITIGGPKSNNVTREVIAAAANTYNVMPYRYDELQDVILVNGTPFHHLLDANNELSKDYGIVIRFTNLMGGKNICRLVAFGLRGRGTWGAVKAITIDKEMMKKIEKEFGLSDFALLLEFNFNNNTLIGSKVYSAVKLIA